MNLDRFKEPEADVLSDRTCSNCGNQFYEGETATKSVDGDNLYCDVTCYLLDTTTIEIVVPKGGLYE